MLLRVSRGLHVTGLRDSGGRWFGSHVSLMLGVGRWLVSAITASRDVAVFAWKSGAVVPGLDCSAMGRRLDKTRLNSNLAPPAELFDRLVSHAGKG